MSSTSPTRIDGTTREIVRTHVLKGLAWLPDGSGLVYASAAGSTLRYPPVSICAPCRETEATIGSSRSATCPYVDPEIVQPGKIFASRIRMQSDIWQFPISGTPAENVRNGTRLTHQTAQVQTPSASPDGKQIVVSLQQRRAGKHLGGECRRQRHSAAAHDRKRPGRRRRPATLVSDERLDPLHKDPCRAEQPMADQIGWQRSPSADRRGTCCGMVSRWPVGVLHRSSRQPRTRVSTRFPSKEAIASACAVTRRLP